MIATIEDLKQTGREMPWFAVTVLMAVAVGVGLNVEVIGGADGDQARVAMSRVENSMVVAADECERAARRCGLGDRPGVTMVIGVRSYRFEMTIPESVVRDKLDGMTAEIALLRNDASCALRKLAS
jgi:hypothetical protein